jgi:hypothetical protein
MHMGDESTGGGGRMLTVLLLAAIVISGLFLLMAPRDVTPGIVAEQERLARAWADRGGLRITGVTCNGRECEVFPEVGKPFVLLCHDETGRCSLPSCSQELP